MAEVLHAIEGRLRIRAVVIKHDMRRTIELVECLRAVSGVCEVHTNQLTGSATIRYDAAKITSSMVCQHLELLLGPLRIVPSHRRSSSEGVGRNLVRALLKSAMEAAVQRALLALI